MPVSKMSCTCFTATGLPRGSVSEMEAGSPCETQRCVPFLACEAGTPPPWPMVVSPVPLTTARDCPLITLGAVAFAHSELACTTAERAWSRGSAL